MLLVILLMGAAAAGGYFGAHEIRVHSDHRVTPRPASTPSVLAAATAAPSSAPPRAAAVPSAAGVAGAVAAEVADPGLGARVVAQIVDAETGSVLYDHLGTTPVAPASTAKLLVAAALLAVRAPTDRIVTTVVAGPPGTVVLVGGGDPTLTSAPAGKQGAYADAARIGELADQLRAAHVSVRHVIVDDALYSGPLVSPQWAAEDVPSSYAAPVTAVMADGGRAAPNDTVRSATPDLDAGRRLADAVGASTATVARGSAQAGASTLATVRSAPLSELVEQMLQQSDNVIAECLARQVAVARHAPASFAGAAASVRAVLAGLGADPGAGMYDGSGLAAGDRLSAVSLAAVLRLIVGAQQPELHDIVAALPVAAWSGTLESRYVSTAAGKVGAGVVRAKTGTLAAVSSLAGIVHDVDGRLLVFALVADQVPAGETATHAAEAALDRVASTLATCGCR